MDRFYLEIGARLRMERLRQRYSLQEVAERIKVTKKTVHNYETGISRIDVPTILKICQVLGVDPRKLIISVIDTIIDPPQS